MSFPLLNLSLPNLSVLPSVFEEVSDFFGVVVYVVSIGPRMGT